MRPITRLTSADGNATSPMEQLNQHQYKLLKRLANSPIKVYCSPAGINSDKRRDEINEDFNSILRLVELGLMTDVSSAPKFKELVKQYREDGRDVIVVNLNVVGGLMFKRVRHGKWIN